MDFRPHTDLRAVAVSFFSPDSLWPSQVQSSNKGRGLFYPGEVNMEDYNEAMKVEEMGEIDEMEVGLEIEQMSEILV